MFIVLIFVVVVVVVVVAVCGVVLFVDPADIVAYSVVVGAAVVGIVFIFGVLFFLLL